MRDKWYGDNRDLVKWGVLFTLAKRFSAKHILQVLYYRQNEWPDLELDGQQAPLPAEVIRHFRHVGNATSIQSPAVTDVFVEPFTHRDDYLKAVIARIGQRTLTPGIVFLDSDMGLEPRNPTFDHVLDQEVTDIWSNLQNGDLLVFYQHQTNRRGQPWIGPKKAQFEQAIKLPINSARLARSEQIARDVVFFYAQKDG